MAFTRHGTFPERANVPPTSGNSHRGAARTRTLAHAPRRGAGCPRTHTHLPGVRHPRGDALAARAHPLPPSVPPSSTSSTLPSAAPGGPGRPPCLGAPPINSRGAGGRGESPVGPAPPRAPLPGGDHAHSPPQEGITQGSLLLICIHLQAGYSPHFLTACHRQRPVPAVSPSRAGSAGRAAGRGAPGTVRVPASTRSRRHRGDLPVRRFYSPAGFPRRRPPAALPSIYPQQPRAALGVPATDPPAPRSALPTAARPQPRGAPHPSPAAPARLSAGAGDRGRAAGRLEGAARSSRCCSPGKSPRRKEGSPPGALVVVVAAAADPAGRSCCSFAKG